MYSLFDWGRLIMNLHIEDFKEGQVTVLKLAGEIDAYTAPQLKEKLLGLLREENADVKSI